MPAGAAEHPEEEGAGRLPVHSVLGGLRALFPLNLGSDIRIAFSFSVSVHFWKIDNRSESNLHSV